jgi:hypothetical protein
VPEGEPRAVESDPIHCPDAENIASLVRQIILPVEEFFVARDAVFQQPGNIDLPRGAGTPCQVRRTVPGAGAPGSTAAAILAGFDPELERA